MRTIKEEKKMGDVSDLFCRNDDGKLIEGFIGDNADSRLLFVLKEPDASSNNVTDFWFKKNVVEDKNGGKKYYNTLAKTALKLIGRDGDTDESVLKRCAFINVYPFSGKASESSNCTAVISELKDAKPEEGKSISIGSNSKDIASNRKKIINHSQWDYVVTVRGIFEALHQDNQNIQKKHKLLKGFIYGDKPLGAFEDNGRLYIKIRHPSRISYEKLKNMVFKNDVIT